ncbi:MAG: class I SAM-dependent methyltransferase [Nitrospiraceae bacterium]
MSNPAETYESYMVPALFRPWASRLIEYAKPQRGERVLDVACGTGIAARQIAPRVGSDGTVVGLDLSRNMLAVARAMSERENASISWHEGRAESLPFPDGSFDLVLCQQALQFFTDRQAALAQMHRVLTHGGRLALSVWQGLPVHPFYQILHDVIQQRLGMSGVQDIFALGEADELVGLLAKVGFRHVAIEPVSMTARFPDPEGFLSGEIDVDTASIPAMQHVTPQDRRAVVAAIREDMAAALRDVTEDDHVVLPFHSHLARADR